MAQGLDNFTDIFGAANPATSVVSFDPMIKSAAETIAADSNVQGIKIDIVAWKIGVAIEEGRTTIRIGDEEVDIEHFVLPTADELGSFKADYKEIYDTMYEFKSLTYVLFDTGEGLTYDDLSVIDNPIQALEVITSAIRNQGTSNEQTRAAAKDLAYLGILTLEPPAQGFTDEAKAAIEAARADIVAELGIGSVDEARAQLEARQAGHQATLREGLTAALETIQDEGQRAELERIAALVLGAPADDPQQERSGPANTSPAADIAAMQGQLKSANYIRRWNESNDPEAVKAVQRRIAQDLGLSEEDFPIDGKFAGLTEEKLKEWQAQNGLDPDGIVGPETFTAMNGGERDQQIDNAFAAAEEARQTATGTGEEVDPTEEVVPPVTTTAVEQEAVQTVRTH